MSLHPLSLFIVQRCARGAYCIFNLLSAHYKAQFTTPLLPHPCFAPAKLEASFAMCDLSPDPCDCQRRSLPDIRPGRISIPPSRLVASGTMSTKAGSSSPASVSGGSHFSYAEPSPVVICPAYTPSVSPPRKAQLTRVACDTCRRRRTKVKPPL